jgi:Arc/MetJ family transcription regulator
MRTNIDIDDDLMKAAMEASGKKTKKETVEEALRELIRYKKQLSIIDLAGKVKFDDEFLRERGLDK